MFTTLRPLALLSFTLLLPAVAAPAAPAEPAKAAKPNVLIILADDKDQIDVAAW